MLKHKLNGLQEATCTRPVMWLKNCEILPLRKQASLSSSSNKELATDLQLTQHSKHACI